MRSIGQIIAVNSRQAARRNSPEVRCRVHDAPGSDRRRGGGDAGRLIDADVIHQHVLRERHAGVRRTQKRGRPPDGQIQQKEEWSVENPLRAGRQGCRRHQVIGGAVYIPDDGVRRPLDGVHVVIVVDRFAERQRIRGPQAIAAGIPRAVRRSVVDRGVVMVGSEVLHDVDFAGTGPRRCRDVLAQHPEGGPDALAERQLDASLDPAV